MEPRRGTCGRRQSNHVSSKQGSSHRSQSYTERRHMALRATRFDRRICHPREAPKNACLFSAKLCGILCVTLWPMVTSLLSACVIALSPPTHAPRPVSVLRHPEWDGPVTGPRLHLEAPIIGQRLSTSPNRKNRRRGFPCWYIPNLATIMRSVEGHAALGAPLTGARP